MYEGTGKASTTQFNYNYIILMTIILPPFTTVKWIKVSPHLQCESIVKQIDLHLVLELSWGPTPSASSWNLQPVGSVQHYCKPDCEQTDVLKYKEELSTANIYMTFKKSSLEWTSTWHVNSMWLGLNWHIPSPALVVATEVQTYLA